MHSFMQIKTEKAQQKPNWWLLMKQSDKYYGPGITAFTNNNNIPRQQKHYTTRENGKTSS